MTEPEPTQALAQVPTPAAPAPQPVVSGNNAAVAQQLFGVSGGAFFCSFDPKSAEGKKLFRRVMQDSDDDLMKLQNVEIAIQHLYACESEKYDETSGELIPLVRIVVIDPEGKAYQCFSKGVRKSIWGFFATEGPPPWNPPIRCVPKLQLLGNGRQWLTLEDAPAAEPPPVKGKR